MVVQAGVALPCEVSTCPLAPIVPKIGRASCRERMYMLLLVVWAVQVCVEIVEATVEGSTPALTLDHAGVALPCEVNTWPLKTIDTRLLSAMGVEMLSVLLWVCCAVQV